MRIEKEALMARLAEIDETTLTPEQRKIFSEVTYALGRILLYGRAHLGALVRRLRGAESSGVAVVDLRLSGLLRFCFRALADLFAFR
jgi:hypothetical protein